jgi:hypothetical protein
LCAGAQGRQDAQGAHEGRKEGEGRERKREREGSGAHLGDPNPGDLRLQNLGQQGERERERWEREEVAAQEN